MVVKSDALYYIITIKGNHNNKISLAHTVLFIWIFIP